jgi:phosphonate transport system substrate-binding protein
VRTVRFGVSRSHGGAQLIEGTRHFSALLGARLGLPCKPIITNDYDHLLEGVLVAGIDLGWMPPLVHLRAAARDGLLACVSQRAGAVTYRAALLVRADSDYATLADLRGARAAWTDRASSSGYLFPRLHLLHAGIDPERELSESLLGSPAAALAAVIDGKADLCGSFVSDGSAGDPAAALADVARSLPAAAWRLRVLAVTDSIPPDGLVLAPGIDGALQARLRDLLLSLHQTPDGTGVLRELFGAERLVPVSTSVARALERLRALAVNHL